MILELILELGNLIYLNWFSFYILAFILEIGIFINFNWF